MAELTLVRKSTRHNTDRQAYALSLEITSSTDIDPAVFVKQRVVSEKNMSQFTDVFVAIATPEQMEALDAYAPGANISYFREPSVVLYFQAPTRMEEVFNSIVSELQVLVSEVEVIENFEGDKAYTISSSGVTES